MAKLSPADQAFFLLETPERPMGVGVLVVLAPPRGSRGRFADRLVAGMLTCPAGPPFNYRLTPGPVPPLLAVEEVPDVDVASRVHRHRLHPATSLKTLFARVCEIHVRPLPRSGPLWEMHVFAGLPEGRVALYFKFHHGIMDGLGFLRVLDRMVTTRPQLKPPHAFWEGLPPAGEQDAHRTGLGALVATLAHTRRTANDLLRLAYHQGLRNLRLGPGLASPFVTTPDVLNAAPTPHRVVGHCAMPLARLEQLARRGEAKINDVVMTLIDIATHRYLAERGSTSTRPLVADVPVGLVDHGGAGNRITILQVPMGAPGAAPAERLRQIVGETRTLKREVRDLDGDALVLYSILTHAVSGLLESLGLEDSPMLANMVISNPAGVREPVYFNGAAVELALPISVVGPHQTLNITATTYVDDVHITFIALREAIPDVQQLADYTEQALDALDRDLPRRRPPRRARAARPG